MPKLHSWITPFERAQMTLNYKIDCMADSAIAECHAMAEKARKGYETPRHEAFDIAENYYRQSLGLYRQEFAPVYQPLLDALQNNPNRMTQDSKGLGYFLQGVF